MAFQGASTDAINLLRYFWTQNGKYAADPKKYMLFDEWLASATARLPRFLKLFSDQIAIAKSGSNGFTNARLYKAMDTVVSKYRGQLPDERGIQNFLNAIAEQAFTTSYKWGTVVQGAKEGVQQVAKIATIGSKVIWIGAIGIGALLLFMRGRQALGIKSAKQLALESAMARAEEQSKSLKANPRRHKRKTRR